MSTFASVPDKVLSWLRYTSVITERLKSQCEKVEMQILDCFQLTKKQVKRDILMLGEGLPCWFARTVIPQATFTHDTVFFEQLKTKPLSSLIYNEPRVARVLIHSYSIDKQHTEYSWLQPEWHKNQIPLWSRTSTFQLDKQHDFYLTEVFLPGLEAYL